VRTFAEKLGQNEAADLMRQTESKEKQADEKLTEISMRLLNQMNGME